MHRHLLLTGPGSAARVPDALHELAAQRLALRPWAAADGQVQWTVEVDAGRAVAGVEGPELSLRYGVDGSSVFVRADDALDAEAALRLLWYLATRELGGVLVHACAVEAGGKAALVTGVSGTGKTTIARHCQALGARLLSDEMIQVLPGRRVHGTPFRSDRRCVGTPGGADLKLWLTIDKGPDEAFTPWPGRDVMRTSVAQMFSLPELAPPNEAGRLASLLDGVATRRFRCRNHPDAAAFLLAALEAEP